MLFKNIAVSGLLSFGVDGIDLPLEDLNVFVGPNGSGKSNLVEILALIENCTNGFPEPTAAMDGLKGWFWKGNPPAETGKLEVLVSSPDQSSVFKHELEMEATYLRWQVTREIIASESVIDEATHSETFYIYQKGKASIATPRNETSDLAWIAGRSSLGEIEVENDKSYLAQFRSPGKTRSGPLYLLSAYDQIHIYRDWHFGPASPLRKEQATDLRADYLNSTGDNLAAVISQIRQQIRTELRENLRELYEGLEDVDYSIAGGTVQLQFLESGGRTIPSTRISDGTLRYLALLSILLHPNPPGLVVIEEPELGLHPDILPHLGQLIKAASERMQLVITTHSQILLDAFTSTPEDIVICQKVNGETQFERLGKDRLDLWLKDHTVGDLWNMGLLGGNRW